MNSLLIHIPFSVLKNPQNPFCSILHRSSSWDFQLCYGLNMHLVVDKNPPQNFFYFFCSLGCLDWEDCSQEWVQRFCNHSAYCCRKVVTFQETPQAILYLLTIGTTKMERYSFCKPFCLVIGTLTISVGCGRHFWLSCLHIGSDGF